MVALAVGLLAGILLALAAPPAWQTGAFCAVISLALLLAGIGRRWVIALAMVAGFVLAQHSARRVLSAEFDCGERRLVTARIETIPVAQGAGWQYDAWVEPVAEPWYPALRARVAHSGPTIPVSGERWQLLLQFDQPAAGESADARRRALLRDHVSVAARVRDSPLNLRLSKAAFSIDSLRLNVANHIQARVVDPSAAALLVALAVGVTGDVSTLQWRVFSATGITHLVAISGMHVTFFALLCMAMARWLWRRWPALARRCQRESFAAVVGVTLAFGYALLSGFSVPAQRTALMLTAFLLARRCGRHIAPTWSVAVALLAVLLLDPLATLSAGFWLSFCAVVSIVVLAGGQVHPPAGLRAAARVQGVVTVALLPVTAALFGSFSVIGPLINAFAIPLFTFALVPPVLVATALYLTPFEFAHWGAHHLVDFAAWAARQSWPWLVRAADLPGAIWSLESSWLWLLLAVPAVVCVLAPGPLSMRLGAFVLLGSGFLARSAPPAQGNLELVMFDVGASRAVQLRTADRQLLVGTGESFGTAGRRFEQVVLPELLRASSRLEVMLDRADRDSLQGLAIASTRLPLTRAMLAAPTRSPELQPCSDEHWEWDRVHFTRQATAEGCWLRVRVGKQWLVVAPSRLASRKMPSFEPISVIVLPRRAADAGLLAGAVAPNALMLASVSSNEWQSTGWRAVRAGRNSGKQALWSTAATGTLRLQLHADGRLTRSETPGWRWGIWSLVGHSDTCRQF